MKDLLLLEEEFLSNQQSTRPREEKEEEEKTRVDELRGSPMSVGNIEELIDDNHAIISSPNGPEYYVNILSFVDKDSIEPGSTVLLHNKVLSVVGLLSDDVDPMVNVMKVEKAPLESYADIGGLQKQIQEVKGGGGAAHDAPGAVRRHRHQTTQRSHLLRTTRHRYHTPHRTPAHTTPHTLTRTPHSLHIEQSPPSHPPVTTRCVCECRQDAAREGGSERDVRHLPARGGLGADPEIPG